jgi:hypothetical protein
MQAARGVVGDMGTNWRAAAMGHATTEHSAVRAAVCPPAPSESARVPGPWCAVPVNGTELQSSLRAHVRAAPRRPPWRPCAWPRPRLSRSPVCASRPSVRLTRLCVSPVCASRPSRRVSALARVSVSVRERRRSLKFEKTFITLLTVTHSALCSPAMVCTVTHARRARRSVTLLTTIRHLAASHARDVVSFIE